MNLIIILLKNLIRNLYKGFNIIILKYFYIEYQMDIIRNLYKGFNIVIVKYF